MKADNLSKLRSDRVWLTKQQCDIEEFRALVERTTNPTLPSAAILSSDHFGNVSVPFNGPSSRLCIGVLYTRPILNTQF